MFKKFAIAALAAATLATSMLATTGQAEARRGWGPAIGFGIAAGALLGAAAVSNAYAPVYVEPAYRCRWVAQYNRFGNYIGKVKVCDAVPY